ncbi:hypothetical protein BsWGS_07760 [Bradybaena similaris]
MTKGKRRNAPRQSASPSKSAQNVHKQAVPTPNSEKSRKNPVLAKPTAESKVEILLEGSSNVSLSSNELSSCKGVADIEPQITITTLPSTSASDNKLVLQHLSLETDSAFTKLIPNDELISCVDSQTVSPVVCFDECQNKSEKTKEDPQLARLSISLAASQNLAPGLQKGSEFWNQAADFKHAQEVNKPTDQDVPQITITAADESQSRTSLTTSPAPDSDDDSICKISSLIHSSSILGQASAYRTSGYGSGKRPKLVAHLSKLVNVESSGPLFERQRTQGSPNPEHSSAVQLSDFWRLKETTEKLHLSTRRPSTMLWKQQYMEGPGLPTVECNQNGGDITDENLTADRKERIDEALEWLRNELQEMRSQDQNLARQLLTIRQDIHQLKLQRSTEEHRELIEDFQSELDDIQEFSDVLDLPQPLYGNNPLKHAGVTRLNISARRFSAC